jgi:NitT/TauT family transport system permease protein
MSAKACAAFWSALPPRCWSACPWACWSGSRLAEAATTPAFQFLRMISPLSWMPVAVMVFREGDAPIYFLLAFAAIWPILLSTAAGLRQLDPQWLLLSRSLAAPAEKALSA